MFRDKNLKLNQLLTVFRDGKRIPVEVIDFSSDYLWVREFENQTCFLINEWEAHLYRISIDNSKRPKFINDHYELQEYFSDTLCIFGAGACRIYLDSIWFNTMDELKADIQEMFDEVEKESPEEFNLAMIEVEDGVIVYEIDW